MNIETQGHVKADGSIDLHLITPLPESEVKIVVWIEPLPPQSAFPIKEDLGWPLGFFERFVGCLADVDLEEPQDLPPEALDEFL